MNQSPYVQNINFGTASGKASVATFAILALSISLSLAGCSGKKAGQVAATSGSSSAAGGKTGNAKIQEIDKAIEAVRNNPQYTPEMKNAMISNMEKTKEKEAAK